MLTPPIPDKAGRGATCERIDAIVQDIKRAQAKEGEKDALPRLLHRLDKERAAFHKLYGYTPKPGKETE